MRIVLIIILISSFSSSLYAQLLKSQKKSNEFFVEINEYSAHVEIFKTLTYLTDKDCDEILYPNKKKNDTLYIGTTTHILKRNENYFLLYKSKYSGKTKKVSLKACEFDNRERFRKEAYNFETELKLRKLQDSLSGPYNFINIDIKTLPKALILISEDDFVKKTDVISDSLIKKIELLKNPIVDTFYNKANSLNTIDSVEIYKLLSDADYKFYYGKFLLYKLSIERPELLIRYVDKEPMNKDSVLNAIKNHKEYEEIIEHIGNTKLFSTGKKQIMMQKSRRINTDVAIRSTNVAIIVSELALLAAFAILIF